MQRAVAILLVLVAIAGAFMLGRWSRGPVDAATGDVAVDAGAAADLGPATADAGVAPSPSPRASRSADANRPATAPGGGRLQPPNVPVSASASGPQPLEPGDEPRLDKAERVMGADGGTTKDLLDLSHDEEQDDQARQLEVLIAQSILRNGGRYTRLRLSAPRCTRSVCIIRGIGLDQTNDPRSDWQRLSGAVMSEPWFREAFDDTRGMVTGDGPDTVYITLYIRCAPGDCRHANR